MAKAQPAADHHTDALRVNFSSPRIAAIAEPVTGFLGQHLRRQQPRRESKNAAVGDRRRVVILN